MTDFETHESGTFRKLDECKIATIKVRNYVAHIIHLAETLKQQPPSQRYGSADGIMTLARAIRDELDKYDARSNG